MKAESYAKVYLENMEVKTCTFKDKELRMALNICEENKEFFRRNGMNSFAGNKLHFSDDYLTVELKDGRVISTPMDWYPELKKATLEQISRYQFICDNTGIEWEELDYHLSIESMLMGKSISKENAA